jgi:hypothetical protein
LYFKVFKLYRPIIPLLYKKRRKKENKRKLKDKEKQRKKRGLDSMFTYSGF